MSKKTPIINIQKIFNVASDNVESKAVSSMMELHITPIINALNEYPKLTNYFIDYFFITLVKIVDNHCKHLIIKTIDNNDFDIGNLFNHEEFTITVNVIDDIKKKEFTKGRLVASNFNFQNIKDILFVFSKLLNIDILNALKEIPNEPYFLKSTTLKNHADGLCDNWDDFLKIFAIRNQIAHSLRQLDYEKFTKDFFANWTMRTSIFLISLSAVVKWYFFVKQGKSPTKEQLETFLFYKTLIKKHTKQ